MVKNNQQQKYTNQRNQQYKANDIFENEYSPIGGEKMKPMDNRKQSAVGNGLGQNFIFSNDSEQDENNGNLHNRFEESKVNIVIASNL